MIQLTLVLLRVVGGDESSDNKICHIPLVHCIGIQLAWYIGIQLAWYIGIQFAWYIGIQLAWYIGIQFVEQLQDLPRSNIWSADNPVEVLNQHRV